MSSSYLTKNHAKFYLKIHLVLVCKYRKPLLKDKIDLHIKKIIKYIEKKSKFSIDIMESDKDHIHLLLDIIPTHSISSIVNRLKAISTFYIWRLHEDFLKKHFWKEKHFGLLRNPFRISHTLFHLLEKQIQILLENILKLKDRKDALHHNR